MHSTLNNNNNNINYYCDINNSIHAEVNSKWAYQEQSHFHEVTGYNIPSAITLINYQDKSR